MTKEDKVRWDQLRDLKATITLDIDEMTALLATQPEDRDHGGLVAERDRLLGEQRRTYPGTNKFVREPIERRF